MVAQRKSLVLHRMCTVSLEGMTACMGCKVTRLTPVLLPSDPSESKRCQQSFAHRLTSWCWLHNWRQWATEWPSERPWGVEAGSAASGTCATSSCLCPASKQMLPNMLWTPSSGTLYCQPHFQGWKMRGRGAPPVQAPISRLYIFVPAMDREIPCITR